MGLLDMLLNDNNSDFHHSRHGITIPSWSQGWSYWYIIVENCNIWLFVKYLILDSIHLGYQITKLSYAYTYLCCWNVNISSDKRRYSVFTRYKKTSRCLIFEWLDALVQYFQCPRSNWYVWKCPKTIPPYYIIILC